MPLISHDIYPTSRTTRQLDHVGSFVARSYELIMSSQVDDWSVGRVTKARTGSWHVFVERVIAEPYSPISSLVIISHRLIGDPISVNSITMPWDYSSITISVENGSIGVFDEEQFVHADVDDKHRRRAFRTSWEAALAKERVKVMDGGVVCKTGIGDGAYRVDVVVGEGGWVVGLQVDFASDTSDEWGKKFAKEVAERRGTIVPY